MNPYRVLRISRCASDSEIQDAYGRMSEEAFLAIDGTNPDASARYDSICEAFAILSDPARRNEYDEISKQCPDDWNLTESPFDASRDDEENADVIIRDSISRNKPIRRKAIVDIGFGIMCILSGLIISLRTILTDQNTFMICLGTAGLFYGFKQIGDGTKKLREMKNNK